MRSSPGSINVKAAMSVNELADGKVYCRWLLIAKAGHIRSILDVATWRGQRHRLTTMRCILKAQESVMGEILKVKKVRTIVHSTSSR